jgi:hypothetical protein
VDRGGRRKHIIKDDDVRALFCTVALNSKEKIGNENSLQIAADNRL